VKDGPIIRKVITLTAVMHLKVDGLTIQ